jgi:peptidoglycan/xylan/chitin deacetylase (PgdA/CDA1 family)
LNIYNAKKDAMEQVKIIFPVLITGRLYKVFILLLLMIAWTGPYVFGTGTGSRTSKLIMVRPALLANAGAAGVFLCGADTFYQPPILCYHQVRDWKASDSRSDKAYIMPVKTFAEHMKILHESGYQTLLPEEWLGYMERHEPLPEKCFILTFDDGSRGQFSNALSLLNRYNYKAVFFIMTVTIDKDHYLTRDQLQGLCKAGHVIGCHTWSHPDMRFLKEGDWYDQVVKPGKMLRDITGNTISCFAYPYGSWNSNAVQQLKKNDYKMAFQLNGPYEKGSQMFTIRRIAVDGRWSSATLMKAVSNFNVHR